jgi:hypothetical protein
MSMKPLIKSFSLILEEASRKNADRKNLDNILRIASYGCLYARVLYERDIEKKRKKREERGR